MIRFDSGKLKTDPYKMHMLPRDTDNLCYVYKMNPTTMAHEKISDPSYKQDKETIKRWAKLFEGMNGLTISRKTDNLNIGER